MRNTLPPKPRERSAVEQFEQRVRSEGEPWARLQNIKETLDLQKAEKHVQ